MATAATTYPYDVEGPYHDMKCPCPRHCRQCFVDLDEAHAGPRERYCSDYCRNRAKRERALDRLFSGAPHAF